MNCLYSLDVRLGRVGCASLIEAIEWKAYRGSYHYPVLALSDEPNCLRRFR